MSTFEKTAVGKTRVDRLDRALGWVSQPAEVQIEELRVQGVISKWLSGAMVLDAHDMHEIGRAEVPHHLPRGYHGDYFTAPARRDGGAA